MADPEAAGDFQELRELLIGPERREIRELQTRVDDARRARDVSDVLADAIAMRGNDPDLNRALSPAVEHAINRSVRRNAKPLADALFPVMGPAIRKSIAHALGGMVHSLEDTFKQSFSWRSIRWRIDAWRTGRTFYEIVLANTIVYRVEQVFLIHRESGLMLLHATDPSITAQDPDMISGMLTAIRDFARDSFGGAEHDSLHQFKIGELSVWTEQGPDAVLAAVIRGAAPHELHSSLQDAIEAIHDLHGEQLHAFSGDTAVFEGSRPVLEDCLQSASRQSTEPKSRTLARSIYAVLALGLLVWIFFYTRDLIRWNRYLALLKAEPGIVVVATGRESGRHTIVGLRDPFAADPAVVAREANLADENITARWELYQALNPAIVIARAKKMLRPPDGVDLRFDDGVLLATGAAPHRWIEDARRIGPVVSGVVRYDDMNLQNADLLSLKKEIESVTVRFVKGTTDFAPGQDGVISGLLGMIGKLSEAAGDSTPAKLQITGHTDSDGAPGLNLPLSKSRADTFRTLIQARKITTIEIITAGAGASAPLVNGVSESEKARNRRVSFQIDINRIGRS